MRIKSNKLKRYLISEPTSSLTDDEKRLIDSVEACYTKAMGGCLERPRIKSMWNKALDLFYKGNSWYFYSINNMDFVPVQIDEFIESPEFLLDVIELWPNVKKEIIDINRDPMLTDEPITEVLLGGGTGTGKTTSAQISTIYQLYVLSCFRDPQKIFKLAKSTQIAFILQSVTRSITDKVIYRPLREMFLSMEFVKKNIRYNRKVESEIRLSNNVNVIQPRADSTSIVGQAILAGIIDEVNFMDVVAQSKKTYGARGGAGGAYDQADILHKTLKRRRKSRFRNTGISIGSLIFISSIRHDEDFLSRRVAEVNKNEERNVYAAIHSQYEMQPADTYCGETFNLLVGNEFNPTKVLEDREVEYLINNTSSRIEKVPIEYKIDFINDPENALRDITGIASSRISSFFSNKNAILDSFEKWNNFNCKPWVHKSEIDLLDDDGLPAIIKENLPSDIETIPRFIGIDLSQTKDRTAIFIVKPLIGIIEDDDSIESLPRFLVECAISIKPYSTKEIDIVDIRKWVMRLVKTYKVNVSYIAYDTFNSPESIQILRKARIRSGIVSVDGKKTGPYKSLRNIINSGRLICPYNEILQHELFTVEENVATGVIDHPHNSGKDLVDALARAVECCLRSRYIRDGICPVNLPNRGGRRRTVRRRSIERR